jgi:hypothetical protein
MRSRLRAPAALFVALLVLLLPQRHPLGQSSTLVPAGATWTYLDTGANQGTAWRTRTFDDSAWKSGAAELGYGDGDETTVVGYGPSATAKYVTTYFRHAFTVSDPSLFGALALTLRRDDGAVVYLNGTEVFRSNMPSSTVTYTTLASTALSTDENAWVSTTVNPALLAAGANVLAVEVHQANASSSDLGFDLSLTGGSGVRLTRGPYLNLGTPSSIVLRWRTSAAVVGHVRWGTTPGATTWELLETAPTTEHKLQLTELLPSTTYYYAVGTATGITAGGDATYRFTTPPPAGTPKATRAWVVGDSGTGGSVPAAVRDAYAAWTGSRGTDLWLMLGDNAYTNGTDAEYQAKAFDVFPAMLRSTVLWPALGNHDGYSANSSTQSGPYFSIFTLPRLGDAGGAASNTEAYYSFDYGTLHFVCLDSYGSSRLPGSAMLTWLQNDLASTNQPWVVAYWHHPPYSKGSHDSDAEAELLQMRANVNPILENAGVDLVLSGHSHAYERSFLLDGHYGSSSTFTPAMKKDGGSGREDGAGAYRKATFGMAPHEGTVYVVAGTSGQVSGGTLNHPAMYTSMGVAGSVVLDVNGNRLDATFLDSAGARRDWFTILKGTSTTAAPAAPSGLTATAISPGWIRIRWVDHAVDEAGFEVQRSTDGVTFATVATLGANAAVFNNTGLARTTTYHYRVRAFRGSPRVHSSWSNAAWATTPTR